MGRGPILYRTSEPLASARARWLAELAEALEEAHRVSLQLGAGRPETDEAVVLRVRILAVRAELDALRHAGIGEVRREIYPDWTNLATWRGNLVELPKV